MADERFPIQDGPSVPWAFMAPHEARARRNHGQTLEGLAKRGGLGCAEAWVIVHGLRHRDIQEEEHKRKWIELAERVNREWSTKQARAEVLAACSAYLEKIAERYGIDSLVGRELLQGAEFIKTEVKPTAKDLEELLRKAELKGLNSDCIGTDDRLDSYNHKRDCVRCQRTIELEQARATLEEKG